MIVEGLVVKCDGGYLELAAADAHFGISRAAMRVLLDILLIHLAFDATCLRWTQSAQVERIRQVELSHWVHLSFHSGTYLIQIRIVSATDVPGHCRVKYIQLMVVLEGRKVAAGSQRTQLRGHRGTNPRTAPFHSHESAVGINHEVVLQFVRELELLRMTYFLHLSVWSLCHERVGVAPGGELLGDCLLSELHVDPSTCVVLDLVSQSLTSSLHWADVADLELAEPDRGVEVEALRTLCDHVLWALHRCSGIHISNAVLVETQGILKATSVEIILSCGL